jgi:hypothetical protein
VWADAQHSEDAFDALVAAIALARDFDGPPPAVDDAILRREGWIWGVPRIGTNLAGASCP